MKFGIKNTIVIDKNKSDCNLCKCSICIINIKNVDKNVKGGCLHCLECNGTVCLCDNLQ